MIGSDLHYRYQADAGIIRNGSPGDGNDVDNLEDLMILSGIVRSRRKERDSGLGNAA